MNAAAILTYLQSACTPEGLSSADAAEASADLALALVAIRRARSEFAAVGGRTGAADIAEIRAGRFLAQHGATVLKALSASQRSFR